MKKQTRFQFYDYIVSSAHTNDLGGAIMSDTILSKDYKRRSVTSIIHFRDAEGRFFVLLARPDPRYRDFEGNCLKGHALEVGSFQFIGGRVDNDEHLRAARKEYDALVKNFPAIDKLPHDFDRDVAACALKEIKEEASLDILPLMAQGTVSLFATVTRGLDLPPSAKSSRQDIYYLAIDLGTLSMDQKHSLLTQFKPLDDLIATLVIDAEKIGKTPAGEIRITPASGHYCIKRNFDGFPEIHHWDFTDDPSHGALVQRIHDEIRGMQGIDEHSLNSHEQVKMYDPLINGVRSDGTILSDFLSQKAKEPPHSPSLQKWYPHDKEHSLGI